MESVHRVAACAVDSRGRILEAAGDIESPVFVRSAAKPFIAGAVVAAGVRDRFDLRPREIAVMAASHSGQPFHLEAVRSILRKIGMDESALQCGAHAPYDEEAAKALRRGGTRADRTPQQLFREACGNSRALRRDRSRSGNLLEAPIIPRSGGSWSSARAAPMTTRPAGRSASTAAEFRSTRRACGRPRSRSRA